MQNSDPKLDWECKLHVKRFLKLVLSFSCLVSNDVNDLAFAVESNAISRLYRLTSRDTCRRLSLSKIGATVCCSNMI